MAYMVLLEKMYSVKAVINKNRSVNTLHDIYKCFKIYPTNKLPVTLLQLLVSNAKHTES